MVRTLPIASLVTAAAIFLFAAPVASAQTGSSDVPAYLLATAAAAEQLNAGDARFTVEAEAVQVFTQLRTPLASDFRVDVPGRSRGAVLPMLYASLGALQGMDFYTTRKGMALGAHETNVLVRKGNTGATLALKGASSVATIFIAEKMWKSNKGGAIALMVVTNVLLGAVVANNANVIGQMQ